MNRENVTHYPITVTESSYDFRLSADSSSNVTVYYAANGTGSSALQASHRAKPCTRMTALTRKTARTFSVPAAIPAPAALSTAAEPTRER